MRKTSMLALFVRVLMLGAGGLFAQSSAGSLDDEIQLLRKDLRSEKKQVVASNMQLTDAEAERFWPVYDRFTAELTTINDAKTALIRDYAQNYSSMTDQQADGYLERQAAIEEAGVRLRSKYIPVFRQILSGKSTALFFQIERRIDLLIELDLASQLPLIEP
jgi:hypothetical protein